MMGFEFEFEREFLLVIFAIFGASFGSFLNVVAHRSIEGRSWWGHERSICESCKHVLGFWELIPILSWLCLRGKCKNCGAKISVRYLLVELITASAFGLIIFRHGLSFESLLACVGICGMMINSLTDIETGEIFDVYTLSFVILGLLLRIYAGFGAILDGFLGALFGFGIFALIIILSRGGMGWGDATFMSGMGALLGWKLAMLAFYIGIMFGGICVLILLLIGRLHWGKGESVPLVPFLSVGCFVAFLCGNDILANLSFGF